MSTPNETITLDSALALVTAAGAALLAAEKKTETASATLNDAAVALYAVGERARFIAPSSPELVEGRQAEVVQALYSGFGKIGKLAMLPNSKGLNAADKKGRKYAQNKRGTYLGRIVKHLADIEAKETEVKLDRLTGMPVTESADSGETDNAGTKTVLAALKLPEKPTHAQLSALAAYILTNVREAEPEFFNGKKVDIGKGCTNLLAAGKHLGFDVE